MKLEDFDYHLPEELIAQTPAQQRDSCRLMVLNREKNSIEHRHFHDILEYERFTGHSRPVVRTEGGDGRSHRIPAD